MQFLYNFIIKTFEKLLPLGSRFNEKLEHFTAGRSGLFQRIAGEIDPQDKTIWFHAASLGEYEQAVPVIQEVRRIFPEHKIILSFFSPSGYEVKKNSSLADVVTYMPLDTPANAEKFLDLVHPEWAIIVKYEFWPNFLNSLMKRGTRTLLISGVFREDQPFFKPWGKWMQNYLEAFEYFFLQDEKSLNLLKTIGYSNAKVSGDTRFDRVYAQLSQDNSLDFIEDFVGNDLCLVAGSTWPQDEQLLVDFINSSDDNLKVIIAPHAIKPEKISELQKKLEVPSLLYTDRQGKNLGDFKVFIIDTVGLLTRIYSYADLAYVGGAAGDTGLHNILEPAAFGLPVVIGKNFEKFPEASELQETGGLFSVADSSQAMAILNKLVEEDEFRNETGLRSASYIEQRKGATSMISEYFLNNR